MGYDDMDRPSCSAALRPIYCHRDRTHSSSICFLICIIRRSLNLFCKPANWVANALFPPCFVSFSISLGHFPRVDFAFIFSRYSATSINFSLPYYPLHGCFVSQLTSNQGRTNLGPAMLQTWYYFFKTQWHLC